MEAPHPAKDTGASPERKFKLDFSVHETKNSTEESPILIYSRNGFSFKAKLDLIQNTVEVTLDIDRPESFSRDWQILLDEVEKLATAELQSRREKYSEYFVTPHTPTTHSRSVP